MLSTLALLLSMVSAPLQAATPDEVLVLLRAEKKAEALDAARDGVTEAPDDVVRHELLIDILMNVGLGTYAESAYAQLSKDNPDTPMHWYLLGRAAVDVDGAREAYQKALKLDASYGRAHMGMAAVDRAVGDLAAAEDRYRLALKLDPSLAEAWAGLGGLLIQAERLPEAIEVCLAASKAVPSDPEAWLALSALEPHKAQAHLLAGSVASPNAPRIWEALGNTYIDAGDFKAARKSLDKALELAPRATSAELKLVLVRELESGRLDLAGQAELARARSLAAESPVAAELMLKDLEQKHPDCYLIYLTRGHMYAEQELFPQALKDLQKARELAPESADVNGALGLLLLNAGMADRALPMLQSAHNKRPWDVELGMSMGLATVHVDGVAAGVQVLARIAEDHPTDVRPVMALVTVLTQAGRTDAAYKVLDRAVARLPHPTLYLSLAAAAKDLDKPREAAAALRELERLTGDEKFGAMADELSSH